MRTLRRHLGYSTINITGLAVGMACCLLILVYIIDETSYDRFHENSDRIARLAIETKGGDEDWRGRVPTFYQLADLVGGNLSGVEKTVRIAESGGLLEVGDEAAREKYQDERILLAEASFFDAFTVEFQQGVEASAFENPYSAVITTEAATKYFGNEDPMGETLMLDNEHAFEVTGVVEEMPANSHMHFDVLLNLASTHDRYSATMFESMGAQWIYTYLLMEQPESQASLNTRVNDLLKPFIPPNAPVEIRMAVQPLTDIHLRSQFASELEPGGDIRYLYIFGAVAIFILVIACVNFMNLATARSSIRAREVGVRKLLGAHRAQLMRQFLSESTGMSLLAVFFALALAALALPVFNSVTAKTMTAATFFQPAILGSLFLIALSVGLLSGSYPAFFLSSFRPVRVLKGTLDAGRKGGAYRFRQGLVVLQFSISIAIVLGSFIVYEQLQYMQNTYPGFDRDQVLSVSLPGALEDQQIESLKSEALRTPGIRSASAASHAPPQGLNSWRVRPPGAESDNFELISWIAVDHDYAETLGLEIVAGRMFSEEFPSDEESAIVINEAMARYYGLDEPVGSSFDFTPGLMPSERVDVVGVVKDYHQTSLHDEIRPAFFFLRPNYRQLLLNVNTEQLATILPALEASWAAQVTEWPFEFSFLDDRFNALYESEQRLGRVFGIFSFLAVFVACMGLFGLSAYMTERRTREVGVRKTFGASVHQLTGLLTRDFVGLVLIAYIIAAPLTWMAMQRWLEDFAFRAEFGAGLFVMTAVLTMAVAGLTVSYQAIRAALMNPVETLRYE